MESIYSLCQVNPQLLWLCAASAKSCAPFKNETIQRLQWLKGLICWLLGKLCECDCQKQQEVMCCPENHVAIVNSNFKFSVCHIWPWPYLPWGYSHTLINRNQTSPACKPTSTYCNCTSHQYYPCCTFSLPRCSQLIHAFKYVHSNCPPLMLLPAHIEWAAGLSPALH